jgi:hypothetical protein
MVNEAKRKGFIVETLGTVGTGDNVYLFSPNKVDYNKPNVLLMAGFHGDEAGGVYGVDRFLKIVSSEWLNSVGGVNLTIAPAVNPAGLRLCQRHDYTDTDPNRGYCHHEHVEALGEVGDILMKHANRLSHAARHGFLTLHEDGTLTDEFYMISSDVTNSSTDMMQSLLSIGERHFKRLQDGLHHEHFINEGRGSWFCDSSFEDMLSHDGVNRLYVLETPADAPVEFRAQVASEIVYEFITQVAREPRTLGTEII